VKEKTAQYEIDIDMTAFKNLKDMINMNAYVKIGVLSNHKSKRGSYGIAQIASVHEFGGNPRVSDAMRRWFYNTFNVRLRKDKQTINIPERSFLRLSMTQKASAFNEYIASSRNEIFKAIVAGRWLHVLGRFGAQWVSYVLEAFDTRGWGFWPALSGLTVSVRPNPKKLNMLAHMLSAQPLQNSGDLRRAITFEVKRS